MLFLISFTAFIPFISTGEVSNTPIHPPIEAPTCNLGAGKTNIFEIKAGSNPLTIKLDGVGDDRTLTFGYDFTINANLFLLDTNTTDNKTTTYELFIQLIIDDQTIKIKFNESANSNLLALCEGRESLIGISVLNTIMPINTCNTTANSRIKGNKKPVRVSSLINALIKLVAYGALVQPTDVVSVQELKVNFNNAKLSKGDNVEIQFYIYEGSTRNGQNCGKPEENKLGTQVGCLELATTIL